MLSTSSPPFISLCDIVNLEHRRMEESLTNSNAVDLATELTGAWLSNPNTRANSEEVPGFLKMMHAAVAALGRPSAVAHKSPTDQEHVPAVTIRRSLASKDYIISLIDGKPYKSLRRHLSSHGLTPEDYRKRYGLKADYPMVAPNYADQRRELAKKIGLGRKPKASSDATSAPAAGKRTRRRTAKATS
jgi:predicted transcriptional regulator